MLPITIHRERMPTLEPNREANIALLIRCYSWLDTAHGIPAAQLRKILYIALLLGPSNQPYQWLRHASYVRD